MKTTTKIIIGIVSVLVLALLWEILVGFAPASTTTTSEIVVDENGVETVMNEITTTTTTNPITGASKDVFTGKITAVDTGCFADATCSVTVGDKKVILVTGGRGMDTTIPVGKLVGAESIGDLENMIGQTASVYAKPLGDTEYTLYGSSDYYVEVRTR